MIDTRQDGGAVGAGKVLQVVQGGAVVAANPTLITNITAVTPTCGGYLVAYQDGTTRPSPCGAIDVYNSSSGVQIVVDCLGYFSAN
ncbi:MAG: hypothetical protein ACJ71T_01270 [Actinomycetales bacterium]